LSTPSQVAWIFPEYTGTPAARDEVLAFLDRQEQTDRGLLALRYGYALDLGAASWVQDLDAALVDRRHWQRPVIR
jgi:hypothetical protein